MTKRWRLCSMSSVLVEATANWWQMELTVAATMVVVAGEKVWAVPSACGDTLASGAVAGSAVAVRASVVAQRAEEEVVMVEATMVAVGRARAVKRA